MTIKTVPLFLGIDPGKSGGIVAKTKRRVVIIEPMPETERDVWDLFVKIKKSHKNVFAVIEEVDPRRMGRTSAFTFGRNYQSLRQSLIASHISFQEIRPLGWMKVLNIPANSKLSDKQKKERLRSKAQQLFPELKLWQNQNKTYQLKVCDALLVSHYCELVYK